MSDERLSYEDLLQIVELIKSSSQFSEFRLKVGEIEVEVRRGDNRAQPALPHAPAPAHAAPSQEAPPAQRYGHVGGGEVVTELAEPPAAKVTARMSPLSYPEGAFLIRSPMVGTFYRAPEPGARPFVELGQQVEPDTTVCIIEVMKLMNSIPAGSKGIVTHIPVADADSVEYGQVLMVIEPQ